MANGTNGPFGLQINTNLTAGNFNGQLNEYEINPAYATAIFSGDPVTMLNNGTIGRWATGNACSGTFWGCKYIANVPNSQGNATFSPYWPGNQNIQPNTSVVALIADDQNIQYDIQSSISGNVVAATSQLGVTKNNLLKNADVALGGTFSDAAVLGIPSNPASGSTISGQSGYYLDTSTIDATPTRLLKIIRLTPRPGNVLYTAANNQGLNAGNFNNVVCVLNNNAFKGGTGTAGGQVVVATGTIDDAAIKTAHDTPVQIVAAPGAGFGIMINSFVLSAVSLGANTQYANGGIIGLQFGTTAALAGTRVTTTQAATIFTTQGNLGPWTFTGVPAALVDGGTTAGSVRLSNATVNFANGTTDYQYTVTYTIVPLPY